jgi:dienelactone hydrolase
MIPAMTPFLLFNRYGVTHPKITTFLSAVRSSEGATLPIGASGFCWGGKHVVMLSHNDTKANDKPLVDAIFTGHPSMINVPGDFEKVSIPLSIAIGDKDAFLPMTGIESVKKTLERRKSVVESEVVTYEGAGHGFALRFDPGNDAVAEQSKKAEGQALDWFGKWFEKVKY